jgi:hypothetical protein
MRFGESCPNFRQRCTNPWRHVAQNPEFLPVAPSGPHNFAVGLRFSENVCTPRIENLEFHIYFLIKVALILIQGSLGKKVYIFFLFLSGIENNLNSQKLWVVWSVILRHKCVYSSKIFYLDSFIFTSKTNFSHLIECYRTNFLLLGVYQIGVRNSVVGIHILPHSVLQTTVTRRFPLRYRLSISGRQYRTWIPLI